MSDSGNSNIQLLPSITGSQTTDRLIRSFLLLASGSITAVIMTWLNSHGFRDPNLQLMVSGAVFSTLSALAVLVWGYINGRNTEKAACDVLAKGVAAGISHAEDPSTPTVAPAAVTPKVAENLVAAYSPEPKT